MGGKKKVATALRKFYEKYEVGDDVTKATLAKVAEHEPGLAKSIADYNKLCAAANDFESKIGKAYDALTDRLSKIEDDIIDDERGVDDGGEA